MITSKNLNNLKLKNKEIEKKRGKEALGAFAFLCSYLHKTV